MASSFVYDYYKVNHGLSALSGSRWNDTAASYFVTLVSNNYTPNPAHPYASAFSGAELSSTSHTGGYSGTIRLALATRSVFSNTTSHQAEFRASDVTWSGISAGVAAAFVVMLQAGSDGNSPLVVYCSLGGFPITTNGGNVPLSFANSGIFLLQDA